MADNDGVLVERCLAGEEDGLCAFVEKFQGMIYGICFRMLGHREDAEDVAQDVFLRIFRALDHWDSNRPLKPWLITIAANRCRTVLEKRRRLPQPSEFADRESTDWKPESADLGEELQLGLEKLREEYRQCFILFHQQGMSCAEIGEMLNCPEGTVKTWLHRARRELAEFLTRRGVVPDVHHELQRV